MAATVEDFEVLNELDFLKLKEICLLGIPDAQRKECWQLLLGVDSSVLPSQDPYYSKQTRGQVERYCKQRGLKIQDLMENTISAFLAQSHGQYSHHLVSLAGPCCIVFQQSSIQGFTALMSRIGTV
jgi:hypothetical protein